MHHGVDIVNNSNQYLMMQVKYMQVKMMLYLHLWMVQLMKLKVYKYKDSLQLFYLRMEINLIKLNLKMIEQLKELFHS